GDLKSAATTEARFQQMSKQHVLLQGLEARVFHNPDDPVSRLRLARLCRDMGLTRQAINNYNIFLRLQPQAAQVARELEQIENQRASSAETEDFVLSLPSR